MFERFFTWLLNAFWNSTDTKTPTKPNTTPQPPTSTNTPDWSAYGKPDSEKPQHEPPHD